MSPFTSWARRTTWPAAGVNDEPSAQRSTVSAELLQHSVWGDGCKGWTLLTRPALHVTEEEMTAHTQERRHVHSAVTQFYYVLDGEAVVDVASTDLVLRSSLGS